jgi:lipopolysaccharide/colanic/teichoic acid biosynthesis glycosyltransferase
VPRATRFGARLWEQIPILRRAPKLQAWLDGLGLGALQLRREPEDARRKHQFDLYYVKTNSLFLNLLILIKTVSVVLFREGQ